MRSPFTGGEAVLKIEKRCMSFRREEYSYIHLCYECVDTKEQFTTTELDTLNISQVYNQYKVKHYSMDKEKTFMPL